MHCNNFVAFKFFGQNLVFISIWYIHPLLLSQHLLTWACSLSDSDRQMPKSLPTPSPHAPKAPILPFGGIHTPLAFSSGDPIDVQWDLGLGTVQASVKA